jgi:membrane-bound serine protease (ClpP class)
MKKALLFWGVLTLTILVSTAFSVEQGKRPLVYHAKFEGAIGPVSAKYLTEAIRQAEDAKADCLIIEMDTPGGLDESMREIIKAILSSEVPVVVYVSPTGSRAASAGVFITLAAHVAAMAPSTNIGAAHPVAFGGGKIDSTMGEKVANDAAAYIRTLAEKRGRNADWAEQAVRQSVSLTEKQALEEKVIDLIAPSLPALLDSLNGRMVQMPSGERTLNTRDAEVREVPMGIRFRILLTISNPNIAYFLLMIGMLGLYFEFSHPGAILPGVVGAICLILFLFSLQTLSLNVAGLLLIVLATVLFIVDIKAPTHGVLTTGGIISMILGSVMLFNAPEPALRVSWGAIIPTVLVVTAFFVFVLAKALGAQTRRAATGKPALIGEIGEARTRIDKQGTVFVSGEHWNAVSDAVIEPGEKVRVLSVDRRVLKVEKA